MSDLSHLDDQGQARMVDVGQKSTSRRLAVAEAYVDLGPDLVDRIAKGDLAKGDVLAVARIAGIQAAKRCPDTIPLCHGLELDYAKVDFEPDSKAGRIRVLAETATTAKTGVEMEALCAASAAALTIYDMCKAVERGIRIDGLRLLRKEGGRSGVWEADS